MRYGMLYYERSLGMIQTQRIILKLNRHIKPVYEKIMLAEK